MQFIISKPGIQKKEENQEKNAEYTVGLHNTKNERESKLNQITEWKVMPYYYKIHILNLKTTLITEKGLRKMKNF